MLMKAMLIINKMESMMLLGRFLEIKRFNLLKVKKYQQVTYWVDKLIQKFYHLAIY
jgi:hypothetical protein